MQETKAFLKNQKDILDLRMIKHLEGGAFNYVEIREICNLVISITIIQKGIEGTEKQTTKKKKNGEK